MKQILLLFILTLLIITLSNCAILHHTKHQWQGAHASKLIAVYGYPTRTIYHKNSKLMVYEKIILTESPLFINSSPYVYPLQKNSIYKSNNISIFPSQIYKSFEITIYWIDNDDTIFKIEKFKY